MTATTYLRGHKAIYTNKGWQYIDGYDINKIRECNNCGKLPTSKGYDACIGYVNGAKSVCCGHGVSNKYIIKEDSD